MSAARSLVFDLSLLEALSTAIKAQRDLRRAEMALVAARKENRHLAVLNAKRVHDNATDTAASAWSSLRAAVVLDAEERA